MAHTALMVSAPEHSVAGVPLLATKSYVPRWRPGLVSRPRLIARLNQGKPRKLTLVSAPAGFGKTTLLAEWLAATQAGEQAAAWVSLDRGDNDPALFWTYVITALQTQRPGVGGHALSLLHSPQSPPIESVLTMLINELAALTGDVTLVLDDLHVIDAQPVHDALAFLLDHLPPRLRLVVATRADPPLPLARLRGRGELTELRAADLRFTAEEAAAFFNEMMGLQLAADDVAALETRTEGWIAGLQLAALSMQGQQDIPGFIRTFAGDHRYVVDYLVEEVLQRQPEGVRDFLLQTSILDRLNGALCDAVTGQDDGSARLEALERGNFFVVPLDDQRRWYRYHHLFADVLRAHLEAEQPEQVTMLHQRASAWFERHGSVADAIRHALVAGDVAHAADLIERALPALRRSRLGVTLLGWLKSLPDELIRYRPVLSVAYAWALMAGGELEAVETRLRDAERWLEPTADGTERPDSQSGGMVFVDDEELRRLPGAIAVYRAARSFVLGDVAATVTHAQQVLDLVAEDDHLERGGAAALLGLASWASGDLKTAHRAYSAGMASLQQAGHFSDVITGAVTVADLRMAQGRLRDAEHTLEQAVQRAAESNEPSETADLYLGLSELRRERNDLNAATQHLLKGQELARGTGGSLNRSRWCVAMARIREAQGDLDGALSLLDEAERLYVSDFSPNVRPIAAVKTRVWIAQGRLSDALDWVRGQGLSAEDELSYLREFEHITLARVLIARAKSERVERSIHEAIGLLERLLTSAEEGGRMGSVIEILALQALAHQAQGDLSRALAPLERALTLAEPESYVRTFVDQRESMRDLLRHAAANGVASPYVRQLLRAFDEPVQPSAAPTHISAPALAEPLTTRQIEILRLIAAGLRNQEIADRLFLSLPTVKRHIANAYGNLGVSHRTEAIARANELNLL